MKKYKTNNRNGFIIFLHSCDEDKILNLEPVNNISNDASYSSPSLIQLSVNGMYNAAQIGQYNSTTQMEEEGMFVQHLFNKEIIEVKT
jgi:hypothetical protein